MTKVLRLTASILGLSIVGALPSAAQTRPPLFVSGSVGTFSVRADNVDGQSAAVGVAGGIAVSRVVDVAIEWVRPTSAFTRSGTGLSVTFAPVGSSREEIERLGVVSRFDHRREVTANFSALVIVHPRFDNRVTPGLIVGISSQRAREHFDVTPVSIPAGVDPQHPSVVARHETTTRNLGALVIGGNLAIAVTPRMFIVPEVRYDYGSIGDEINNVLRSSVGVMWRF